MYGLPVGVSDVGEMHLVMDSNVSKPIHAFYLLFLLLFLSRGQLGDTALAW
jgi:hypothetical protein